MCSPNFSMIGASSTTCGMNGWSTRAPRCIKAECPGLAPKVGQEIAPLHCTAGGILPGAKCLMLCHKNYIFEDGTREKNVQCQSDGSWDKSQEDCVSTKVSITCPADVHEHLPPDDAIAWLQFDIKSATEPTTAHPRIRKNGHSYEYGFDLGVTEISFSTQNRFTGELASCSFFVDVVDDTPPISKNCQKGVMHHFDPDRQIFYDPKFEDNTGVMRIDVEGLPRVPMSPGQYLITYRAFDKFNNVGLCQVAFLVEGESTLRYWMTTPKPNRTLKSTTTTRETTTTTAPSACDRDLPTPLDGRVSCRSAGFGKLCHVMCPNGFTFSDGQSMKIYICRISTGRWEPNTLEQSCPNIRKQNDNCPAGQETRDDQCEKCDPGTFRSLRTKSTHCITCPAGYYQPRSGSFGCRRCPTNLDRNGKQILGLRGAKDIKYCYRQ